MDGMPGLIHSGDDFGINSAGLVITETTITGFKGFDPAGIPEFVRARKAMQYAASIDDFDRIMRDGNNGGYANAWLVADTSTGEIARLELGLRNVTLERTKDGYFVGANFPVSPKLAAEETKFKLDDPSLSANARRVRAERDPEGERGQDRRRARQARTSATTTTPTRRRRTRRASAACAATSTSPPAAWATGSPPGGRRGRCSRRWRTPRWPERMALEAAMGHPCGRVLEGRPHLAKHPAFAWAKPLMRDLVAHPWTLFEAR